MSSDPMIIAQAGVMRGRATGALRDFIAGLAMWELWGTLGWNDIVQRYRRSVIGPLWLTLSMGIMVLTIGFVYSTLFGQSTQDYMPYLALGFIGWSLLSSIIFDSSTVFVGSEGVIRQVSVPYSVHVLRMLWRNLVIFAHNILIYLGVIAWFRIYPGANIFWILPSLILIGLNGFWIGILFGALSARFRDLQQIVFSVMQIFFYITPIVWKPEQLSQYPAIVSYNPLHHFLELLRAPLLGSAPTSQSWICVLAVTVIGYLTAFLFLMRFRGRIAYWL
jgi:ABC-2 type transport system permease protein/lipopolysaccharide transport system permease protein